MDPKRSIPAAGRPSPLTGLPDITRTAQTAFVDIAAKARDKAQAVAQAAADTVEQNRGPAARVLANAATTIQEGASRLSAGEGARLARAAAGEIDAAAQYVRQHTTQQMMADLTQFVRRHPGVAVAGAAVVGVLVGRAVRKQ